MIGKVFARMFKVFRRLQQSLAGYTANIGAGAAQCRAALCVFPLVDTRHAEAQLGGANGCDVTARPTPNNDHIEILAHGFQSVKGEKPPRGGWFRG